MDIFPVDYSVKITRHDRETAIKVLQQSSLVRNWLTRQCEAFGLDIHTVAGKKFAAEQGRKYAERLIR